MQISLESTATTEQPYLDEGELDPKETASGTVTVAGRHTLDPFLRHAAVVMADTLNASSKPINRKKQQSDQDAARVSALGVSNTQPILEQVKERVFYAREEIQLALDVTSRLIAARKRMPENPLAIENQLRISNINRKTATTPMGRIRDLQYLQSSKAICLRNSSSALARHSKQLAAMVEREQQFYGKHALALRHHNWPLHPRLGAMAGAILYVDYGFRKAGSYFAEIAEADILRTTKTSMCGENGANDGITIVPVHQYTSFIDIKFGDVSLLGSGSSTTSYIPYAFHGVRQHFQEQFSVDLANGRLAVFEAELFQRLIKELSTDTGFGRQTRLSSHAFLLQLDHQNVLYAEISKNSQVVFKLFLCITSIFQPTLSRFILGRFQNLLEDALHDAIQPLQYRLDARLLINNRLCSGTAQDLNSSGRFLSTWTLTIRGFHVGNVRLCSDGKFECSTGHRRSVFQHNTIEDVLLFMQVNISELVMEMIASEAISILGPGLPVSIDKVGQSIKISYRGYSLDICIAMQSSWNACFKLIVARFSWTKTLWLLQSHTLATDDRPRKFMDDVQSDILEIWEITQK
ncbi:hypothetical protein BSLG_008830 [Batrachochytrium salamandrivorans]|nr:hypothetical protein BSLG_008830 [Batrachochytrium salamandrivorans]